MTQTDNETARLIDAALGELETRVPEAGPTLADASSVSEYMGGKPHTGRPVLGALLLDSRRRLIGDRIVSAADADPRREVTRAGIEERAAEVILYRHDPSGDATPGPADHDAARRVGRALGAAGVELRDHVVVGRGNVSSLASLGLLQAANDKGHGR